MLNFNLIINYCILKMILTEKSLLDILYYYQVYFMIHFFDTAIQLINFLLRLTWIDLNILQNIALIVLYYSYLIIIIALA